MDAQDRLVELLSDARLAPRQIQNLDTELCPSDNAEGYAINARVAERLGWEPLGWKIAATTSDVRERLKVDTPIYGRTYRKFAQRSPCHLERDELLDPLIECEFFFTLKDDLPAGDRSLSLDDVRSAVGTVHAGIEMAECRFPNTALPPLPAILADGAASGRYLYGDPIAEWQTQLENIPVRLEVDGVDRRAGHSSEVMGDPLLPLHWLADTLRQRGLGLKAGEMISTGSCTGMMPLRDAHQIVAYYGDVARVEISIT